MIQAKRVGIVLSFLWPFLLACSGSTMSSKPAANQAPTERPMIEQVQEQAQSFEGKAVTIEGKFKGWKGKCAGGPPVTRSDWMLEDKTGCIYVSGPVPDGLSAISPRDEQVSVKGIVRINRSGKGYVEISGR